jgi:hypothetical protein
MLIIGVYMSTKEKEWSKKKLQAQVKEKITQMFESVLDLSEVALGGEEGRYKALRSKILKIGNDTIRCINGEIEGKYEVEYKNLGQDVIKISHRSRRG